MTEHTPEPYNIETPRSRFDTIIEWLLMALFIFMPFAFGVVHAWSEEVVLILSGTITMCFLFKFIYFSDTKLVRSWTYLPLGVFLLIAVIQLIPLPSGLMSIISPNTYAIKAELLNDSSDAETPMKLTTVSFYPNATKHDLRLVLAIAAVFVVVLNVFRQPEQIKRLLMAIVLTGGLVTLITFAQNLFGNGKIYGLIPIRSGGYAHCGPFVNHSHYGQFINLSIGAALGLIIAKLHEDFAHRRKTPIDVLGYFSSQSAKSVWLMIAIIILGATSVFTSLTRSGMLAMLIVSVFTTFILARRQYLKAHNWLMVVSAMAAFICILYIGFDAVYDRLATLRNIDQYGDRLQILKDLLACFKLFPVLGTGLGTHLVVYPMFDNSSIIALASHAENEYAQALEETGLIGLGALIIFGIIILSGYAGNIRTNNPPICSTAYGLGFGLLAILIQSLSDFGQHLPANAFLSAIFCALLTGLPRAVNEDKSAIQKASVLRNSRSLSIAVFMSASIVWVWVIIGADNARIAENCWNKVIRTEENLTKNNWQGTKAEFADLNANATAAANRQPENIKYRYWLAVYRWRSIIHIDPNTNTIVVSDDSMPLLYDITDDLNKATTICPTFGATYCVLGQIEKLVFDEPSGAEKIRKGFRLAPCDPVTCFTAGLLDIEENKIDQSFAKFRKAAQLDSRYFEKVVDVYIKVNRPDLAAIIAGDDISRLNYLANILTGGNEHKEFVNSICVKVMELLRERCSQPDAPDWVFASLANIYEKQQCNQIAVEYYRHALALNYGHVHWRLALAKLLAKNQKISEAMNEARICLRIRPQFEEAEKLIGDLSVNPATFGKEIESP